MLDKKKYKEELNKCLSFAEEFHYLTESYIYEVFDNDYEKVITELEKYLETLNIEIIHDISDDLEPSDEELSNVYSNNDLEELDFNSNDNINFESYTRFVITNIKIIRTFGFTYYA